MKLIAIAAVSIDGKIAMGNNMLWHIPEDIEHLLNTTMGHTLIMGYNTFKTIPKKMLKDRLHIVLSKNQYKEYPIIVDYENVYVADSIESAMAKAKAVNNGKVFIAGGSIVYDSLIEYCDEAIITWVNRMYPEADKLFPTHKLLTDFNFVNECGWIKSKEEILYKICYYKNVSK